MKRPLNCKNCGHRIWCDDIDSRWRHSHMLHNDNCPCRNPEPRII